MDGPAEGHLPLRATPPRSSGNGDAPRVQLLASGVGLPLDPEGAEAARRGLGRGRRPVVGHLVERARPRRHRGREVDAEPPRARTPRSPSSRSALEDAAGPIVAVSDYMRAVPLQIAHWMPGDYHVLGTDGFGFADTRPAARRFFQVDAESVVVAHPAGARRSAARSRPRSSPRRSRSTASTTRPRSPTSSRRVATHEPVGDGAPPRHRAARPRHRLPRASMPAIEDLDGLLKGLGAILVALGLIIVSPPRARSPPRRSGSGRGSEVTVSPGARGNLHVVTTGLQEVLQERPGVTSMSSRRAWITSDEPSTGTSRRSCSLAGRLDAIEHECDVELIGTHNREALQPGATESVLSTHIQRLPRTLAVIGSVVLAHVS